MSARTRKPSDTVTEPTPAEVTPDETTETTEPTPAEMVAAAYPVETYRAGDAKIKGKIRADLDKAFRAAVAAGDLIKAQAIMAHQETLKSTPAAKAEVPVEVTIAQRVADLFAAAQSLLDGTATPDGVESYSPADVAAHYLATVTPDAESVTRLATAKITKSTKVNNVAEIIQSALDTVPAGTVLTVAQIAATVPGLSDGAVAARLFPAGDKACTVSGVVPVSATADRARGARKA